MAYRVTIHNLNIREHESTGSDILGQFADGEILFPTEEKHADIYVWQKHKRGWSASHTIDKKTYFMRPFNPRPGAWLLEVPYRSQLSATAKKPKDCGQSHIASFLSYYRYASVTVDQLSAIEPGVTDAGELIRLARRYGLQLQSSWFSSIDQLPASLEKSLGRPHIVLVDYKLLDLPLHGLNSRDQGWHWIAIVGMDADKSAFYFHDPLWLDTTVNHQGGYGGAFLRIEMAQLKKAALLKNSPVII